MTYSSTVLPTIGLMTVSSESDRYYPCYYFSSCSSFHCFSIFYLILTLYFYSYTREVSKSYTLLIRNCAIVMKFTILRDFYHFKDFYGNYVLIKILLGQSVKRYLKMLVLVISYLSLCGITVKVV